ncbi:MAG: Riboflavin biosynthesis protein RibD [Acidimicrobiales bacterium]|nr:Riboflavin biosynthesis protein RibD [Acidimicrobiales bacterium]
MADNDAMRRAVEIAERARAAGVSPRPWVGCVIEPGGFEGATEPRPGRHAEAVALAAAGDAAHGATAYVTLEPCALPGHGEPCAAALIGAGVRRVVVGIEDPDPHAAGRGIASLRAAGIDVELGPEADAIRRQLAPYLIHRTTGRPFVTLKLAATLDGRTAAPDGSSRWITGEAARRDAHRLRAEHDAVLVGAGTVKADDPELTVRHVDAARQPLRVVLGRAPAGAKVQPCVEVDGPLEAVLDELGTRDVMSLLVEGGATVAGAFHRAGLVDRYVVYLAPAFLGGDDGRPLFAGPGAPTMADVWRGRVGSVTQLGDDVRIDVTS